MRYLKKAIYFGSNILWNVLFRLFPLQEAKVLFLSDVREELSGNLAYVAKALPDEYKQVYSFKADRRQRRSFREYLALCFHLATARVIFLDDFSDATAFLNLRRRQQLVQLWHGSGAYKKFAYARGGENGDLKRIHPGYKRYSLAITSSRHICKDYANAFRLPLAKVAATGIPRTDLFFDEKQCNALRETFYATYPALRTKKIVLFAPTYRGDKVEEADYDCSKLDLHALCQMLGEEYVFLIKWHPAFWQNVSSGRKEGFDLAGLEGFAYDVSAEREVNDLLLVADVLVTDYSSVIFDYALLHRPIVYFAYDLDVYADGRGLFYPFKDYQYGPVAQNTYQLAQSILAGDLCEAARERFTEYFISEIGRAHV